MIADDLEQNPGGGGHPKRESLGQDPHLEQAGLGPGWKQHLSGSRGAEFAGSWVLRSCWQAAVQSGV